MTFLIKRIVSNYAEVFSFSKLCTLILEIRNLSRFQKKQCTILNIITFFKSVKNMKFVNVVNFKPILK